jgi:hypothetical protein
MTALLALVLAFAPLHQPPGCVIKRDSRGRIARSRVAVHRFMREHPCPGGPDRGSRKRCRGYVVDHRCALECCGADDPSNMQWQTRAEGHAKDLWEMDCARSCHAD